IEYENAVTGVAEGDGAVGVRADEVTHHGVARRVGNLDAVDAVSGNDIARARGRAADGIGRRPGRDQHAVADIADGDAAAYVDANEVPDDFDGGRPGARDFDPGVGVSVRLSRV